MTAALRVIETGLATGRWNTALSAALLRAARSPDVGASVRFYRFTRCVLLGAGQRIEEGVDLAHCAHTGIEIARRITGGGSVYMSPSMLAWDLVMPLSRPIDDLSTDIGDALAMGLQACGIACVARRDGLLLNDRKISGAAMTSERGLLLYQGTLLLADETDAMAQAIGVSAATLAPHVTSLARETGRAIDPGRLIPVLAAHLALKFDLEAQQSELTPEERASAVSEHAREIGTEAYVQGLDMAQPARAYA